MRKTLILILFFFALKSYSTSQTKFDSINNEIDHQILILKQKNDSLAKRLDYIEKSDYKSIDVIEKVNDFYDKSWNKLIAFLSIAGSIILVIIPYIQNKNFEESINNKEAEFQNLIDEKVTELETKINKFHHEQFEIIRNEINLSENNLNKNIENQRQYAQAFIHSLRGLMFLKDNKYDMYFSQYIAALSLFVGLNKTSEIKSIIIAITENIEKCIRKKIKIENVTKSRFDGIIPILEKDFNEIFPEGIKKLKDEYLKLIS